MTLRLIKTIGGSDGAPSRCNTCYAEHFLRCGIAWNCSECGSYQPRKFPIDDLKESLAKLEALREESKFLIEEFERLIKE